MHSAGGEGDFNTKRCSLPRKFPSIPVDHPLKSRCMDEINKFSPMSTRLRTCNTRHGLTDCMTSENWQMNMF